MTLEFAQAVYIDDGETITFAQLVERSGLTADELRDLVECGAMTEAAADAAAARFSEHCILVARTARRLRDEYALEDSHSLAVVVRLTQRIAALEGELRQRRGAADLPMLVAPRRAPRRRQRSVRCASAGRLARTLAMRAGSISPTTTPGPSASRSATISPQGSTSIEWPYVRRPPGCTPPCAAAST
jgi:chaperone modulatory protein CbpM